MDLTRPDPSPGRHGSEPTRRVVSHSGSSVGRREVAVMNNIIAYHPLAPSESALRSVRGVEFRSVALSALSVVALNSIGDHSSGVMSYRIRVVVVVVGR